MEEISVLLVDDDEDFRRAITRRLAKRGIVPEQAASGEECISILDKKPVDILYNRFIWLPAIEDFPKDYY